MDNTLRLMTWAKVKTAGMATPLRSSARPAKRRRSRWKAGRHAAPARQHVQFEGEGFLVRTNFLPDGSATTTWTNYFKVTVRDGEWRIVTQRENEKPDFTETSYDGNEMIQIIHYENFQENEIRKGGVPGKTAGLNGASADVYYCPVPYSTFGGGALEVWFALRFAGILG